jgi:hypothetical protein
MRRLRFLHALRDLAADADDALLLDCRPSRPLPCGGSRDGTHRSAAAGGNGLIEIGVRHATGRA